VFVESVEGIRQDPTLVLAAKRAALGIVAVDDHVQHRDLLAADPPTLIVRSVGFID
jgi:soluble P-type ATPase